jgi:hypothetical protein
VFLLYAYFICCLHLNKFCNYFLGFHYSAKITVLWVVTPCSLTDNGLHGNTYHKTGLFKIKVKFHVFDLVLSHLSTIDQGWSRCWGCLRPSPAIYIYSLVLFVIGKIIVLYFERG